MVKVSNVLASNAYNVVRRMQSQVSHSKSDSTLPKKSAASKPGNSNGVTELSSRLDNLSTGSDEEGAVQAIEDAVPDDDTPLFYEIDANTQAGAPPVLSQSERDALTIELQKTEDEIITLRQVLAARIRHASDLKRRLGQTPWRAISQDLSQGIRNVRDSSAYHRTEEIVTSAGEKATQAWLSVGKKIGDLRSTPTIKSFENRVGSTYHNVKAKLVGSPSLDQTSAANSASRSAPTTPDHKNKQVPET